MTLAITQKIEDGDTVELPSDAEVSFEVQNSGMHWGVWLHAVGDGPMTQYNVNVTDIKESREIQSTDDADMTAVKHLKHKRFLYIELQKQ